MRMRPDPKTLTTTPLVSLAAITTFGARKSWSRKGGFQLTGASPTRGCWAGRSLMLMATAAPWAGWVYATIGGRSAPLLPERDIVLLAAPMHGADQHVEGHRLGIGIRQRE